MSRKKKLAFSDAVQKYNEGDYARASSILSRARIAQTEAGLAKQFKIELNLQTAIANFNKHKYKLAIQYANSNRNSVAKDGFPISFEKHDVLAGIANLYLENFEEAAQKLKNTLNNETTKPFHFYYILACIFKGDYKDTKSISIFNKEQESYFENLDNNKQLFLQAMFYLHKDKYTESAKVLKKIQAKNNSQTINIDALLSILSRSKISKNSLNIKPIYKIFSGIELAPEEYTYLKSFPALELFSKKKHTSDNTYKLKSAIKSLCNTGKPMSDNDFEDAISLFEDKEDYNNLNYLVFNQFSALVSKANYKYDIQIDEILDVYDDELFEIPESIHVFIEYLLQEDSFFDDYEFFNILNLYFNKNNEYLSDFEKQNISFKLYNVIFECDHFDDSRTSLNRIIKLNNKYNLLGFYFYICCIALAEKKKHEFNSYFKKLVEHKFFSFFSDRIIEGFKSIVRAMYMSYVNSMSVFSMLNSPNMKLSSTQYKTFVNNSLLPFMNSLSSKIELNRKSEAYLNFYTIINNYLKKDEIVEHVPKNILNEYIISFEKNIELFNKNTDDSEYQKNYIKLLGYSEKSDILDFVRAKDDDGFINIVKKYADKNQIVVVVEIIRGHLNEYEMPFHFFSKIFYLFKYCYKKNTDKLFPQALAEFNKDIFDVNMILNYATKKYTKKQDEELVYDIFMLFKEKLFENIYLPKSYNSIIDFVNFLKKLLKAKRDFNIPEKLKLQILENLKLVIISKKIIKVENAYKNTTKFFKLQQEIDIVTIMQLIRKKQYSKLENYYHKEFIKKNKTHLFHDFIKQITEDSSEDERNIILRFLPLKVYIDKIPKTNYSELVSIAKTFIDSEEILNFAKEVKKYYPRYTDFYYSFYQNYIEVFINEIPNAKTRIIIEAFLNEAIKAKNIYNFDDEIILKSIKYIELYAKRRNATNKTKECYNKVHAAFGELIEKTNKNTI